MAEQSAEHFTRFTGKYCLQTWQEQHEDGSAIWSIFADLNRPLSPKLPDKDALSI